MLILDAQIHLLKPVYFCFYLKVNVDSWLKDPYYLKGVPIFKIILAEFSVKGSPLLPFQKMDRKSLKNQAFMSSRLAMIDI